MFLSPCNFWIKTNTKYDTQLENWMTPGSIIDHGLCLLKITLLIEMVRWTPSGYFYFLSYLWHFWTWLLLYWSKLLLSFVNVFRCILALVLMTICRLAFAAFKGTRGPSRLSSLPNQPNSSKTNPGTWREEWQLWNKAVEHRSHLVGKGAFCQWFWVFPHNVEKCRNWK